MTSVATVLRAEGRLLKSAMPIREDFDNGDQLVLIITMSRNGPMVRNSKLVKTLSPSLRQVGRHEFPEFATPGSRAWVPDSGRCERADGGYRAPIEVAPRVSSASVSVAHCLHRVLMHSSSMCTL